MTSVRAQHLYHVCDNILLKDLSNIIASYDSSYVPENVVPIKTTDEFDMWVNHRNHRNDANTYLQYRDPYYQNLSGIEETLEAYLQSVMRRYCHIIDNPRRHRKMVDRHIATLKRLGLRR